MLELTFVINTFQQIQLLYLVTPFVQNNGPYFFEVGFLEFDFGSISLFNSNQWGRTVLYLFKHTVYNSDERRVKKKKILFV